MQERFNRYYTDPSYRPSKIIYVSRQGKGDGQSPQTPSSVSDGISKVKAGQQITFLADAQPYKGCWQLDDSASGTYDAPIVLYAQSSADGKRGVTIDCCDTGRKTCFNLEFANYVAIDGFVLRGGKYGIRAVGPGYSPSQNQVGIAMINNEGANQCADPFFSGQSSWMVVDSNLAHGAGSCDGHGIYLSNGGDYMIVRGNELYQNSSSDLQINADPISTCEEEGIEYADKRCDGSVRDGQGQGVSEYILIENNYLHHGAGPGPNFTSMRSSLVRNNIIGPYARHGTSFWQETPNPALGSSHNTVLHNLFIGNTTKHILQFVNHSGNNKIRSNLIIASGGNPFLLENDDPSNAMQGNFYAGSNRFDGYVPNTTETHKAHFDPAWFSDFPKAIGASAANFRPTALAPFPKGKVNSKCPADLLGHTRTSPTPAGPIQ